MERRELERQIVEKEWLMFQQVQGVNGRAACQDDWTTFLIMRLSQFEESYFEDIVQAEAQERNLIMEKYAYMMEETDPVYFLSIKELLPEISEEKQLMAEKITSIYMEWEKEADIKYPNIRRHGRPAEGIGVDGTVSVKCELYTYSAKTLALFILSIEKNPEYNRYLATMQKMVQAYGYSSLEEAEKEMA